MSLDENNLEVRLLEVERRLGWMADALRALQRQQAGTDQQVAMAWTQMAFVQSPSVLGNLSLAKTGAGGIPALTGTTPGSASVTLRSLSGGNLVDGASVTCYSTFSTAVGGTRSIMVGQDALGDYWVISEDCP